MGATSKTAIENRSGRALANWSLALACWCALAGWFSARADTNRFIHPGLLQTREDLDLMKRKVAAGAEPWRTAWETLLRQPYSSMTFEPRAIAHVVRGPYGRPSVGDRDLMSSAKAAHSQALQWVVTGEKTHAQKAIAILRDWSAVLADFHDNDAKLLAGWTGHDFCNAAEILRCTGADWEPRDLEQFQRMLLTVYYPLIKDFFPEANGNWDGAIIDTMLCIAIFCDDHAMFDRAVEHFQRGRGNGGITKYIYPGGQCQESTRDQGHTQLGLGEFAQACRVAWSQGVDLFGAADNRLALGFEYSARYLLGQEVPAFGDISPRGRERLSDVYEPVFQHYYCLKGLALPYTSKVIERTRTNDAWSALVFYQGPPGGPAGSAISVPAEQLAGALAQPTAKAPTGATLVSPGESLQAALDARARAGGGWVVLGKGLYTLPAPLRIPSRITLAGQGRWTMLFLDPKISTNTMGAALINTEANLHDVTIRDVLIEGAATSTVSSDPNADRRRRARAGAPHRAGILFTATSANRMRNLRFEHVTVRGCTLNGVVIRAARKVVFASCDFDDNGSVVLPEAGPQHNLVLADVEACEVRDSRLDTSPVGCGLALERGRNIMLVNNEAARNSLDGLRVTQSRNVRVRANLAEGNDSAGILLGPESEGCRDIDVRENRCRNNSGYGLEINRAVRGVIQANNLRDNGHGEQIRVASCAAIAQP